MPWELEQLDAGLEFRGLLQLWSLVRGMPRCRGRNPSTFAVRAVAALGRSKRGEAKEMQRRRVASGNFLFPFDQAEEVGLATDRVRLVMSSYVPFSFQHSSLRETQSTSMTTGSPCCSLKLHLAKEPSWPASLEAGLCGKYHPQACVRAVRGKRKEIPFFKMGSWRFGRLIFSPQVLRTKKSSLFLKGYTTTKKFGPFFVSRPF